MTTMFEDGLDEAGQAITLAAEEMGKGWKEISEETGVSRDVILRIRKNERRTPKYVRVLEAYLGWPRGTVKNLEANTLTVNEAVEYTATREELRLQDAPGILYPDGRGLYDNLPPAQVDPLQSGQIAGTETVREPTDEELLARLTRLRTEIDGIMVQLAARASRRAREREE